MPFVKPVTVQGLDVQLPVKPPGLDVAVNSTIAEPPVFTGGVNDTDACPLLTVADTLVGAPGTAAGVTAVEASDATELCAELVA